MRQRAVRIEADLRFEVQPPAAAPGSSSAPVQGQVRADGTEIEVSFSRVPSLLSLKPGRTAGVVDQLVRAGISVRVTGPTGTLVVIEPEARAPWWQLPLTRSRHVRLGSLRVLLDGLRGPRVLDVAWPDLAVQTPAVRPLSRQARVRRQLTGLLPRRR